MSGIIPKITPTGPIKWAATWHKFSDSIWKQARDAYKDRGTPFVDVRVPELRPAKTRTPRVLNCSRRSSGSRYA